MVYLGSRCILIHQHRNSGNKIWNVAVFQQAGSLHCDAQASRNGDSVFLSQVAQTLAHGFVQTD